jgi:hypothetical protein
MPRAENAPLDKHSEAVAVIQFCLFPLATPRLSAR